MSQVRDQVSQYLLALWRRKWYALLTAWVVCVAGWIGIAFIPNQYVAKTRVYVDTDTLLQPLLKGMAVDTNIGRQVEVMQRTLLSRPNIESVMRATDLDLRAETPERRELLIREIESRTSIRAEGSRNLFSIEFRDQNPTLARNVIQSLLTIFIESQVGSTRRDMEKARTFLDQQIAQYEQQLKEAEDRVAKFKGQFQGMLPGLLGGGESFQAVLGRKTSEVAKLRSELDDAITRRTAITRQLSGVPRYLEVTTSGPSLQGIPRPPTDLELRLAEAERNLDQLRLRFTERHPDVLAAQRIVEQLRAQAADAPAREAATRGGPTLERRSNAVYDQLQLRLAEVDTEAQALERRLAEARRELAQLETQSQTIPGIEAQFTDLNRDYAIIKKNYEELLGRREAARLSQEVDARTDKVQFRVIDPPNVPLSPSFPNRLLFASAVLLVGIGAGVVLALFLAQIDDSFGSVRQLRQSFSLPILGSVTRVVDPGEKRRLGVRNLAFAASCVALTGVYGAVMAVNLFGSGALGAGQLLQLIR